MFDYSINLNWFKIRLILKVFVLRIKAVSLFANNTSGVEMLLACKFVSRHASF